MKYPKYAEYRERVLAKTNGSNIHKVNGLLGIILNNISFVEFSVSQLDIEAARTRLATIEATLIEIKKLTGVSP